MYLMLFRGMGTGCFLGDGLLSYPPLRLAGIFLKEGERALGVWVLNRPIYIYMSLYRSMTLRLAFIVLDRGVGLHFVSLRDEDLLAGFSFSFPTLI